MTDRWGKGTGRISSFLGVDEVGIDEREIAKLFLVYLTDYLLVRRRKYRLFFREICVEVVHIAFRFLQNKYE